MSCGPERASGGPKSRPQYLGEAFPDQVGVMLPSEVRRGISSLSAQQSVRGPKTGCHTRHRVVLEELRELRLQDRREHANACGQDRKPVGRPQQSTTGVQRAQMGQDGHIGGP